MSTLEAARSRRKIKTLDDDDLYPVSDGKPMAETDEHWQQMAYCVFVTKQFFANRPEVYVAGNNFLYWEQGVPSAVISPDGYVVFGVGNQLRDRYMLWEENGAAPAFVIEITSKKTKREDQGKKKTIYQDILKVPEYFQFDVTSDYLKPNLQGLRLEDGKYRRILPENPDEPNRLRSEILGLDLVAEGRRLRYYDPIEKRFLPSYGEQAEQAKAAAQKIDFMERRVTQEAQRAKQEAEARQAAETELARMKAEMDALRRQMERNQ